MISIKKRTIFILSVVIIDDIIVFIHTLGLVCHVMSALLILIYLLYHLQSNHLWNNPTFSILKHIKMGI